MKVELSRWELVCWEVYEAWALVRELGHARMNSRDVRPKREADSWGAGNAYLQTTRAVGTRVADLFFLESQNSSPALHP